MVDCILLAAGLGKRTGLDYPKQFLRLAGKPLLIHTIEVLRSIGEINNILVSINSEYLPHYKEVIEPYDFSNISLIEGGATRQESVKNCLSGVSTERVIVHEAARPFITKEFVHKLLSHKEDVVVPHLPISFAVCSIDPISLLDKSEIRNIQLPQLFNTELLRSAHYSTELIYDEDSLLVLKENPGKLVTFKVVDGLEENIKITTPLDLKIAEVLHHERFGIDHRS